MRPVAILLNQNARKVTPERIEWCRAHVGDGLYVVSTAEESRAALRRILERGYLTLCLGGGDGTFMRVVTDLLAAAPARLPSLLPLRLGTGNAIADYCRASRGNASGLERDLRGAQGDAPTVPLRLLEVDGHLTHLTGIGLDTQWAADYQWLVKERLGRGRLGRLFRGAPGYLLTALGLTLPRLLLHPHTQMRLVALGSVHRLDEAGRPFGPEYVDGAVLHEGPLTLAAASTITPYSAGMPFFPFVEQMGDRFQIRATDLDAGPLLGSLPWVFLGRYHNPQRVWDFAAHGLRIELRSPQRFHLAGDVHPAVSSLTVRLSPRTVPVLRWPS